jgi:hypothetical protein
MQAFTRLSFPARLGKIQQTHAPSASFYTQNPARRELRAWTSLIDSMLDSQRKTTEAAGVSLALVGL